MKTVFLKDKKIAYKEQGEGLPLILLHGFCEDHSIWEEVLPGLQFYRVIAVDLPGFGQSSVLDNPDVYSMADAVKLVMENCGIHSAVLIGHSMGGYIALAFAEKYEENLTGLGLFNSHPFKDSEETLANRQKAIDFINKFGAELYIKQLIPNLFTPNFRKSNDFLVQKLTFGACNFPPEGIINALSMMAKRKDQKETLNKLSIPVLHIMGKDETIIPHKVNIEQSHLAQIASIHVLNKVGHMAMFEASQKSINIINDFMEFCEQRIKQQNT